MNLIKCVSNLSGSLSERNLDLTKHTPDFNPTHTSKHQATSIFNKFNNVFNIAHSLNRRSRRCHRRRRAISDFRFQPSVTVFRSSRSSSRISMIDTSNLILVSSFSFSR